MQLTARLHLWIGLLGLLAFLVSGQIMRAQASYALPDAPRLYVRYGHLGLMWISALNLLLAAYFAPARQVFLQAVQRLASLAVMLGPPLFLASFFAEAYSAGGHHPMAWYATVAAFVGVLGHSGVGLLMRFESKKDGAP